MLKVVDRQGYKYLVHTLQHVTIGIVGDSKEMGRHFISALSLVLLNNALTVGNKNT